MAAALRAPSATSGRISFDDKGDVRGFEPFVWYVWREGDYAQAADLAD